MRSSIVLATACLLVVLVPATALATYPLPPFENSYGASQSRIGTTRGEIFEKGHEIDQKCLPRELFCVGPFDPELDFPIGQTGGFLVLNDTFVTVGHNPHRHMTFGPYVLPFIGDDLRVCWTGCLVPDPWYAKYRYNATVEVYVLGTMYPVNVRDQGEIMVPNLPIPRSWGCQWSSEPCPS